MESLGNFKIHLNKSLNNFEVNLALRGTLEQVISRGHFHSKLFFDSTRKGHAHFLHFPITGKKFVKLIYVSDGTQIENLPVLIFSSWRDNRVLDICREIIRLCLLKLFACANKTKDYFPPILKTSTFIEPHKTKFLCRCRSYQ